MLVVHWVCIKYAIIAESLRTLDSFPTCYPSVKGLPIIRAVPCCLVKELKRTCTIGK